MLITSVQNLARIPSRASSTGPQTEQLTDVYLGKTTVYATDESGRILVRGGSANPASEGEGRGWTMLKDMFFPVDMQQSVSSDYLITRSWHCARDLVHQAGGFVVGAALFAALGLDPLWGGAGMQTYSMIRDRACQAVGFAASFQVDRAIKNPRAWLVGGEVISNLGLVAQACGALPAVTSNVPGGLLAVTLAAFAVSTVGGVMSGAAGASINPRQAIGDNLGELQVKNGNQGTLVSIVGGVIGLELVKPLQAVGSFTVPVVAAVTGILGALTMIQMVKHLDYHPVNEEGLRRVVDFQEKENKIVGPAPDRFLPMMASLKSKSRFVLGQPGRPLLDHPIRWEQLKHLYQGRQYILEIREGEPYIVLREGCTSEDRLQAALQAVHVERLQASEQFQRVVEEKGPLQAERWLVTASLAKTPADVKPFLAELKRAGWSTDLLRFSDGARRAQWEDPAPGTMPPPEVEPVPTPIPVHLVQQARRRTGALPALALGSCLTCVPGVATGPGMVARAVLQQPSECSVLDGNPSVTLGPPIRRWEGVTRPIEWNNR